jgi:predicted Zn-dependent protease with MMP-like domain
VARERPTDEAYDDADEALSQGEYERVEQLLGAWAADDVRDPEACALVGLARFYEGDTETARPLLDWAVEHDAGGAEAKMGLGACEFLALEIEPAEERLEEVIEEDPEWAAGHFWLARLTEWKARWDASLAHDAERGFARAARLDPEGFPVPLHLSEKEFDAVLEEAIGGLPQRIAEELEDVSVVVDAYPHETLFGGGDEEPGPDLLGLYQGPSRLERSNLDTGTLPGVIHLFQRNLELTCATREELVEEIRDTLLHEVGHFLGMEEEDLEELDL